MKRASDVFDEKERAVIAAAVGEAERRTSGEIVPVVATVSGRYDRSEDLFGLATGLVALSVAWVLFQGTTQAAWVVDPVPRLGLWVVLAIVAVGFVAGAALSTRFPMLRHPFIPHREMRDEVERRANEAFARRGVGHTAGGTGVLIYVSLYERMVKVVTDDAVAAQISQADWQGVCNLIVEGMKKSAPGEGLAQAIGKSAELLASHFPVQSGDADELPNALVVID